MSDINTQTPPKPIVVSGRGPRGFPGPSLELRVNDGFLEWRVAKVDPDPWEPLVDLTELVESKAEANLSNVTQSDARAKVGTGTMAYRNVTISGDDPSGGSDGDVWFKV